MGNSNSCRLGVTTLAVFVATFAFDWVYHGVLLKRAYEATAALWRPEAEMQEYFVYCLLMHLVQAFLLTWIFTRHYEGRGVPEGVRFGLAIGALIGVLHAGGYIYMPIPGALAIAWLIGGVMTGLVAGIVAALVYGRVCKS